MTKKNYTSTGFSDRLRAVLEEKKITMYRLSKETKISASTISNYLKNTTKPDPIKVAVICKYLGVNYDWMMNGGEIIKESRCPYVPDINSQYNVSAKEIFHQLELLFQGQEESIKRMQALNDKLREENAMLRKQLEEK